MEKIVAFFCWVAALPVMVLLLLFIIEVVAALFPRRKLSLGSRGSVAILVPAHNEELVLRKTLEGLTREVVAGDRILVVADNCSDGTAELARSMGVEVVERFDELNRGKGYALALGVSELSVRPPDVVIIVDADCELASGSVNLLAKTVSGMDRSVQALYLMRPPTGGQVSSVISAFAFVIKNHVRARGVSRMGGSAILTGTGMAFPWRDITSLKLASGDIVEDMSMGIDLIKLGRGAVFQESALVESYLPSHERASVTQRTRWEHGHLQTILQSVPRLMSFSLKNGRISGVLNALDLAIPPLSLFVLLCLLVQVGLVLLGFMFGYYDAALLMATLILLMVVSIGSAWFRFAKTVVSLRELLSIPKYVLGKLKVYKKFITGRETDWVRTDRDE